MTEFYPRFLFRFMVVLLLVEFPLHAAPKENSAPAPSPSVGKVIGSPSVVRGGFCEIVVRGIVMPRDSAEFKIHKGPEHGALEGPRPFGRDSAVFIYRHDGKKGVDSDRIDFKLKTGPNNTWGRLRAEIAIVEPPSRVELISNQLDFGPVPIGQTRSAFLEVRNGGGGILRGTLETGAPWTIDGSADFELAEGAAREVRVVFSPDGPGERQGRLDVVADRERQPVTLKGEGVHRFASPERVAFGEGSIGQELKISLTNLTGDELPLAIDIPKPLLGETSLVLPPGGTASLMLAVEKRHYTEKFVDVNIADGSAARALRVTLPPPPALLEWAAAGGVVDLGEVAPRHIPRPEFELRNRGATPAIVDIREGGGGLALEKGQASRLLLEPGKSAVVKTVWRLTENPGAVSASLVASHGGLEHELGVRALIKAPEPEPRRAEVDVAATESPEAPAPSGYSVPTRVFRTIPNEETERLERDSPLDIRYEARLGWFSTDLRIFWTYNGTLPVDFVVEIFGIARPIAALSNSTESRLVNLSGKLPIAPGEPWIPVESRNMNSHGNDHQALLRALPPGHHAIRLGTRVPGRPGTLYKEFSVFVPAPPSIWRRWELPLGLLLVAVAFLVFRWLRPPVQRPLGT
jgi:hypothetical protein